MGTNMVLLLLLCGPQLTSAGSHGTQLLRHRFAEWKDEFQQSFPSAAAEASALSAFAENDARIQAHNRRRTNAVAGRRSAYTLGHNQFSGLTESEFMAAHTLQTPMSRPDFPVGERAADDDARLAAGAAAWPTPPPSSSFDWEQHGAVGPVQQQGTCGACYAFSVAAAMEGAYAIATHKPLVKLSEMDVIECASPPNVLCAGGDLYRTYQWMQWAGISNESYYPYTAGGGGASACEQKRWEHQTAWNNGGAESRFSSLLFCDAIDILL